MLKDKVAIVTGAGRGLGAADATLLAEAGARVVVNDLGGAATGDGADPTPAEEVARAICEGGGTAIADSTDVSSWASAAGLVARTVAEFGRLDILVCNAGICRPTEFGKLEESDWDKLMDVNAKGVAAMVEAAARHWQAEGPAAERAVVCTASPAGAHPNPPLGIYGVTKAAVLAIAQVAAQELAPLGVRVNAIAPVARTRMMAAAMSSSAVDLDRIMPFDPDYDLYDPLHVGRLVRYLVSPDCRFTGRLFGVRADDIYLYRGWDAAEQVGNSGSAWEPEALAGALSDLEVQEHVALIGPMGRHEAASPCDRVLAALAAAGS